MDIVRLIGEPGRLPSEYQEVEYLKSNGYQYIDITYTYRINDEIECEFSKDASTGGIQGIFGNGNLAPYRGTVLYVNNENILTVTIGGTLGSNFSRWENNPLTLGQKYSAKITGNKLYIDGNLALTTTYDLRDGNQSDFSLFRRWNTLALYGKIYKMSIKRSDEYLFNFIPCYRKADDVAGMYDLVNDVFYPNDGTGTFTVGDDVIPDQSQIEYTIADYRDDTMVEYEVIDRNLEGSVDLGTLTWNYASGGKFFFASTSSFIPKPKGADADKVANLYCSLYEPVSKSTCENPNATQKCISITNSTTTNPNRLSIKNKDYTVASEFKSAMSGVILWYETTTQTEITR